MDIIETATVETEASGPSLMTTADATVAALVANGVDTVFGLPGLQSDPLFDALYRSASPVRVFTPGMSRPVGTWL